MIYHHDGTVQLYHGDALDVLRTLPDDSVHAVVTDPPAGISFMNLEFDDDRGGRTQWVAWLAEIMREAYRVLKPGAHGLVWALPRTSHWTACALEDAGFELRDCITHLFGQGFSKGKDVSKAIDAELGATREVVGNIPDRWAGKSNVLKRATQEERDEAYITASATPEAQQWDGFKTALKPASEHWWLIRKPLSERNVARNVLQHGTGGLNIDGCRVGTAQDWRNDPNWRRNRTNAPDKARVYNGGYKSHSFECTQGRYPPNVVLSHAPDCTDDACVEGCPVRELEEQTQGMRCQQPAKSGCAPARFFPCFRYEPKAASTERKGSTHPTQKSLALMKWLVTLVTAEGQTVLDPFAGNGTTLVAARNLGRRAIGVEMNETYCDTIVGRLAQRVLPLFGEDEG